MDTLAYTMLSLGAINAINLDGGGDSTTVINGTVVNKPSCEDLPIVCERPVAGITCIK